MYVSSRMFNVKYFIKIIRSTVKEDLKIGLIDETINIKVV